jgi:ATP-binding cassette subfamily A (ABC1) protein 3
MVSLLILIRQLVTNTDFAEGPRLMEGRGYGPVSSLLPIPSPFFTDIYTNIYESDPPLFPFNSLTLAGYNYTIVGEDRAAVDAFRLTMQPYLDVYAQFTNYTLNFTDNLLTEDDLFDFVRANNYQKDSNRDALLFAIGLPTDPENNPYDYSVYMSANNPDHIPNTNLNSLFSRPLTAEFDSYSRNGFLTLQSVIADHIVTQGLGDAAKIEVFMSMGGIDKFTRDEFMESIGPTLALFILLIFIAPMFRLVGFITQEKASKAREGMKIMGLSDSPYWISWFIYYFSVCLVISILCSILLTLALFPNSSWFYLFLYLFLYGMSLFSFSVLIASFLQRPRIACTLATLIHFLTYFMNLPIAGEDISITVKGAFSFIPNIAMSLATQSMARLESGGQGLRSSTLNEESMGYQVSIAFSWWIIMFFVQLFLALYLDNVLPKEFGKTQHPCFMFTKEYWFGVNRGKDAGHEKLLEEVDEELDGTNRDFEGVPPNIRNQETTGDCMKVRHLKKTYPGGKKAVNDLSLTMYKSQIFALLGHNGAGKTTTLSILTGLYPPTEGTASVFGLDMFGQVNEMRKNLGVCPQFDILFDLLTPIEHLELYCMFKGVPKSEVKEQVEKTIKDVDLESKRNAFAKDLSGGQKRKLSVGIAMIGGSKIVLLDEPTSGMDLTARRKIWDMLKNNKQDKIMILTTHFMDEADILGDRIAIMASGRIKC